jgi:cytochrome c biogenesis protein CcdA
MKTKAYQSAAILTVLFAAGAQTMFWFIGAGFGNV